MNTVDIKLYGIVDPEHSLNRPLHDLARISAENGATLIQYRDKINDIRTMIANARAIKSALSSTGVPLIINDRVDVALASKADGVHLGQTDMDTVDARRLMGAEAIIGLSIKTEGDAIDCPVDVIDYAFIGGVFPTTSKKNPTSLGLDGWQLRANIIKNKAPDLPIGAIAGIDASNARDVMDTGCEGVAVISALYKQSDVAAATRELRSVIEGET